MTTRRRIGYLVPGAMSAHPGGDDEIARRREYLQSRAQPGTVVEVRDNPAGPPSIESVEQERQAAAGLVARLPGMAAGFDGVIIGCFGDPGLAAVRGLLDVPVVGPAQASLYLAAQAGRRVGLITVVEEVVPVLRELCREYGLERTVTSIRAVQVPVLQLRERREEVVERLAGEGRAALADGAEALVLGCMTMGFLDVASTLQELLGAPVVNPVLASLHAAESLCAGNLRPHRAGAEPRR